MIKITEMFTINIDAVTESEHDKKRSLWMVIADRGPNAAAKISTVNLSDHHSFHHFAKAACKYNNMIYLSSIDIFRPAFSKSNIARYHTDYLSLDFFC